VTGVFLGRDFISVNKSEQAQWEDIRPLILSTIMDALNSGKPILEGPAPGTDASSASSMADDDDDEVVAMVKELIDTRIRPAVQEDGGDIFFVHFDHETGIVQLKMAGSCKGCPSSTATLRGGVESMLRHYIPEVEGIVEVEEDGEGGHRTVDEQPEKLATMDERLAAAGVPGFERA
jgi:NFU1 iron-sulfur cluster scaffold homolog, mitochondrial